MTAAALVAVLAAHAQVSPGQVATEERYGARNEALEDWLEGGAPIAAWERAAVEEIVRARLSDLDAARADLDRRARDPRLGRAEVDGLARDARRLAAEERQLREALDRVVDRLPPSPPPPTRDVVVWWGDLVVEPGDRLRHAVAVGGDVVVLGSVERHVGAVGGDVRIARGGAVGGRPLVLAGRVDAFDARPRPEAWIATALAGLGLVGAGVAGALWRPAWLHTVAEEARERAGASFVTGALSSVGAILVALAVAGLGLGPAPVLVTALALALTALAGGAGLLVALGEVVLGPRSPLARTAGFGVAVMAAGLLLAWPPLGRVALLASAAIGVGAVVRVALRPVPVA